MRIKKFHAWLILNIAVFLAINLVLRKSMFSVSNEDGFFIDIQASKDFTFAGMEYLLELVHLIRFAIGLPFLFIFEYGLHPIFESFVLLGFMLPVVCARFAGKYYWLQVLFLYTAYALSYRTILVACSIAYLFMLLFSERQSRILFVASAILANLSSGVVMGWLLIAILNRQRFNNYAKLFWTVIVGMFLSFSFSVSHKIEFFYESAKAGGSSDGFVEALSRNTLVVSFQYGQYARLVTYSIAFLVLAMIFIYSLFTLRGGKAASLFYFCSIPGMFLEGLSVMAFLVPIIWFLLGVRPREGGQLRT